MKIHRFGVILVIACMVTLAMAKEETKQVVKADNAQDFQKVVDEVQQEMEEGGRYEFLKKLDREEVTRKLHDMLTLMQKNGTVAAMGDKDRLALFNDQERLNGLLTHNDKDRLVCERTAPVGSLIPITKCRTLGEIERSRKSADFSQNNMYLQNHRPAGQAPSDGN